MLALWRILSGRGNGLKQNDGYISHNCDEIELFYEGEFVVDGEIYDNTGPGKSINLSSQQKMEVITGAAGQHV